MFRHWCYPAAVRRALMAALMLLSQGTYADETGPTPVVEVSVSPQVVAVGEPATLQVSVYVPTWFVKPPVFPSFEVPNAVTRRPPNSSRPTTRRFGRESWSGVIRSYRIYPLQGADFRLASDAVEISFAQPGSDPRVVRSQTGDIGFRAVVPAGAEALDPYVAGTRFELKRRIDGDPENLEVGDALVVTYEATLEGLPAIFIPEIIGEVSAPGVSVYPEQPVVTEGSPSRRVEKLTFVFNSGGTFEIPGARIDWWDTAGASIATASLAPQMLTVTGAAPERGGEPPADGEPVPAWLVMLVVLGVVLLRFGPGWVRRLRGVLAESRARRRRTEAHAWRTLKHALASGDARRVQQALTHWLERLSAADDPNDFARRYGDGDLESLLDGLGDFLFGAGQAAPDLKALERELEAARRRCLRELREVRRSALPTLNP